MAKKTKTRTVASFLSQRMKQQVNESYDYLEENTRRVQSTPIEDSAPTKSRKKPSDRAVQGATAALRDEGPYAMDRALLAEPAEDASPSYEEAVVQLDQSFEASLPEIVTEILPAISVEEPSILENRAGEEVLTEPAPALQSKPAEVPVADENRMDVHFDPTPVVAAEPPPQQAAEPDSPAQEPEAIATAEDPLDTLAIQQIVEPPFVQEINLQPTPPEPEKEVRKPGPVPVNFSFEIKPSPPEPASNIPETKEVSTRTEIKQGATGDADFVFPERIFNLMMTGQLSLRGIQIYLAMLRDANFRIGGTATLSYSQLSGLTSIQTPHIPAILKILIDLNLVERFRAEKNATAKNSYIIL